MSEFLFIPYKELELSGTVRLVIYDEESKLFIEKIVIASLSSATVNIDSSYCKENLKYKYQIKNDEGKWVDTHHGYYSFYKVDAKELLNLLSFENSSELDEQLLMEASEKDIKYCFRHILIKTYISLLSNPNKIKVNMFKTYLKKLPIDFLKKHPVASHYYSLIKVLILYIEEFKFISPNNINKDEAYEVISKVDKIYSLELEEGVGFRTGWLLTKANVISLYDRKAAYEIYQVILEIGQGSIENFLAIEALTTYYEKVYKKNETYSIQEFENYKNTDNFDINVCFSADASYFKMFAVGWAQSSLYFRNISFNFGLVTHDEKEFRNLVSYYKDLLRSISNFSEIEITDNTRFFYINSSTINKTVYACARFYLSKYILENYKGDVFITDIDQLVIGNLDDYLERVSKEKLHIYQPKMRGYYCILPGRSHLAGNIYIKNTPEGQIYSQVLTDYVGLGLKEDFSWMLDQNATRYASEMFEIGNLNELGERVLKQFPNLKRTLRKRS